MRLPSAIFRLVGFLFLLVLSAVAQETNSQPKKSLPIKSATPVRFMSPQVHSDNSVTFRFAAPNAREVKLSLEGHEPEAMRKDEQGVWSLEISPLAPDYYGYSFLADGVPLIDPSNSSLIPNLLSNASALHVPGPSSLPWEVNDVPRGAIHHHFYKSAIAQDDRDYYVYTPPDYDPAAKQSYPVLYLLHGYSDDASGWTAVGHANVILDNLIASGKAKPMIVVMPLGYGTMTFVLRGWGSWSDRELRDNNFKLFGEAFLTEILPRVESEYHISKDRNARAIAGLSMGGSESLLTGLNHLDQFSWIGAFSSGSLPEDFQNDFPALDAKANQQLHLLWIACGTEDDRIHLSRNLREWLTSRGVKNAGIETPGMHTWMVWRRNLAEFAQLLFQ